MRRFVIYLLAIVLTVVLLSCGKKTASENAKTFSAEVSGTPSGGEVSVKTEEAVVQNGTAAVKKAVEANDDDDDEEEEVDEDKLADCPLTLVGTGPIVIENVTELTRKTLEFELVNNTQENAYYKRTRSSCSCIEITEEPERRAVKPGEKIKVKAMLYGNAFSHSGSYPRTLYVECRGCAEMPIQITVIATCLVDVEPSAQIELGRFEGADVNWVRQVTIKISDVPEAKDVEVQMPQESKRFHFNLVKKEGKREYRFEIRPKLPLALGRFAEFVFLPVVGLGEGNGVRLLVQGEVTGMQVALSNDRIWVKEQDLLEKKAAEVSIMLERSTKSEQEPDQISRFMGGIRSRLPSYQDRQRKSIENGADLIREEEEAVHQQGNREAWEKLAKDMKLLAPDWIQVKPEAQDRGLLYKLTVSDELLNQPNRRIVLTLQNKERPVKKVELRVMARQ